MAKKTYPARKPLTRIKLFAIKHYKWSMWRQENYITKTTFETYVAKFVEREGN
jgi:hypothetical protein